MITPMYFAGLINSLLPEPHAGLLSGILFGTKMTLSDQLKNALQITGTLHIIALSGTNITILTGIFFGTFVRILPRWISSIATVGVISAFVWFVGPTPSIVRAAIMGCITLLAPLTGRVAIGWITWGTAIGIMLFFHPSWIQEVSFQLSALASLGMILFGKKGKNMFEDELITTLSAQVFTIPLILFTFGRISLVSPLTNVLIGWTIPIITVLGLFVCVAALFWMSLAQVSAWFLWVFLEFLIRVVVWTSHIPFASIGR